MNLFHKIVFLTLLVLVLLGNVGHWCRSFGNHSSNISIRAVLWNNWLLFGDKQKPSWIFFIIRDEGSPNAKLEWWLAFCFYEGTGDKRKFSSKILKFRVYAFSCGFGREKQDLLMKKDLIRGVYHSVWWHIEPE